MTASRLGLAALAATIVALAMQAGCSNDLDAANVSAGVAGSAGGSGSAGRSGSSASAGSGSAGKAEVLPALPPQGGLAVVEPDPADYSCGPGCRKAFDISYRGSANVEPRITPFGVVDTARSRVLFAAGGDSSVTYSVGSLDTKVAHFDNPALSEKYVMSFFRRLPPPKDMWEQWALYVWDRKTGEVVHRYPLMGAATPQGSTDPPPFILHYGAAANDDLVAFSIGQGIFRIDLATGKMKLVAKGLCHEAQLIGQEYICADETTGNFRAVNVHTGAIDTFSQSSSLQVEGKCSPQGDRCVWVDYRDAPGTNSSFYKRFGGDIYYFDRPTKTLRRATFDSPGSPRWKFHAAIEGNLITWREDSQPQTEAGDPNEVVSSLDRVVRLDLMNNTRCWFERHVAPLGTIAGRRLWGLLGDADQQGGARPVSYDLDSPDIPWTCEPAAPPVIVGGG